MQIKICSFVVLTADVSEALQSMILPWMHKLRQNTTLYEWEIDMGENSSAIIVLPMTTHQKSYQRRKIKNMFAFCATHDMHVPQRHGFCDQIVHPNIIIIVIIDAADTDTSIESEAAFYLSNRLMFIIRNVHLARSRCVHCAVVR